MVGFIFNLEVSEKNYWLISALQNGESQWGNNPSFAKIHLHGTTGFQGKMGDIEKRKI